MAIDVGLNCDDRSSTHPAGYTAVTHGNPANADGTIDYFCIRVTTQIESLEIASFIDEGSNVLTTNDTASIGTAPVGLQEFNAPGDFTAFAISTGEHLGVTYPTGEHDRAGLDGTDGNWSKYGNYIPCTSETFALSAGYDNSFYATGVETSTFIPLIIMF